MISRKVKFWARLGQISYFMSLFFGVAFEKQLPRYVPTEFAGTFKESAYAIITFMCIIVFSEAIVRLISYFAELLEKTAKKF